MTNLHALEFCVIWLSSCGLVAWGWSMMMRRNKMRAELSEMSDRYGKARRTAYTLDRLLDRKDKRSRKIASPQKRDEKGRFI